MPRTLTSSITSVTFDELPSTSVQIPCKSNSKPTLSPLQKKKEQDDSKIQKFLIGAPLECGVTPSPVPVSSSVQRFRIGTPSACASSGKLNRNGGRKADNSPSANE